jgi:hypothetical protein
MRETGALRRTVTVEAMAYRYQVYVPPGFSAERSCPGSSPRSVSPEPAICLRTYFGRSAWNQVMMPSAKCSIAR